MNLVAFIDKKLPYTKEHINIGNNISQSNNRMKHLVPGRLFLYVHKTNIKLLSHQPANDFCFEL